MRIRDGDVHLEKKLLTKNICSPFSLILLYSTSRQCHSNNYYNGWIVFNVKWKDFSDKRYVSASLSFSMVRVSRYRHISFLVPNSSRYQAIKAMIWPSIRVQRRPWQKNKRRSSVLHSCAELPKTIHDKKRSRSDTTFQRREWRAFLLNGIVVIKEKRIK